MDGAKHETVVETLIVTASDKPSEARGEARQVPEEIGGVSRQEIESALALTEASLKADVPELRGNVAAAHASIRRCRFPRDEHRGLFSALAELRDALADIEDAAAAAEDPDSETTEPLPRHHLLPGALLVPDPPALEGRLH